MYPVVDSQDCILAYLVSPSGDPIHPQVSCKCGNDIWLGKDTNYNEETEFV